MKKYLFLEKARVCDFSQGYISWVHTDYKITQMHAHMQVHLLALWHTYIKAHTKKHVHKDGHTHARTQVGILIILWAQIHTHHVQMETQTHTPTHMHANACRFTY